MTNNFRFWGRLSELIKYPFNVANTDTNSVIYAFLTKPKVMLTEHSLTDIPHNPTKWRWEYREQLNT